MDLHKAEQVSLAGCFNDWDKVTVMKHSDGGHHIIAVQIEPDKHALKFIVDGCWYYDIPRQTEYENMGNLNNVLTV